MRHARGGGLKRESRPAVETERLPEIVLLTGGDSPSNTVIPWPLQHLVARHGVTLEAAAIIAGLVFAGAAHG